MLKNVDLSYELPFLTDSFSISWIFHRKYEFNNSIVNVGKVKTQ